MLLVCALTLAYPTAAHLRSFSKTAPAPSPWAAHALAPLVGSSTAAPSPAPAPTAPPSPTPGDNSNGLEKNVIIYPAVTVGILFLLALCYCYLRSSARQRLLSEQQDDDDVRTAFLRSHDEHLKRRRDDRSVWQRYFSNEDGDAQVEWRRKRGQRGRMSSNSIDSEVSTESDAQSPTRPQQNSSDGLLGEHNQQTNSRRATVPDDVCAVATPRRLRRRGWVRVFSPVFGGNSGEGGVLRRDNSDLRRYTLTWSEVGKRKMVPVRDPRNSAPGRKLLAEVANISQAPFSEKLAWFHKRARAMVSSYDEGHVEIRCRRTHLLEDSLAQFRSLSRHDLRKCFRFSFVGEPALDAGGVAREWYEIVSKSVFCAERGIFELCDADQASLFLSACDTACGEAKNGSTAGRQGDGSLVYDDKGDEAAEAELTFCGQLLGKALLDRRIVHVPLILPLLKHVVAAPVTLRDLEAVDSAVYNSLMQLLRMGSDDIASLGLDFTVTRQLPGGDFTTVELQPGGAEIDVTAHNVEEYVQLRMQERMMGSSARRLACLLLGVYDVLPQYLLSIFDYMELELVVGGVPSISIPDWRGNTVYAGEFSEHHEVIEWFWSVVLSFEQHEQAKVLQFVTGSSRMPAHGFAALQGSDGRVSKFCIVLVVFTLVAILVF